MSVTFEVVITVMPGVAIESDRDVSQYGHGLVGPERGSLRVARGGGWSSLARYCRAAFRSPSAPGYRFDYVGFRLVRTSD